MSVIEPTRNSGKLIKGFSDISVMKIGAKELSQLNLQTVIDNTSVSRDTSSK
jgi:hypothetical protein